MKNLTKEGLQKLIKSTIKELHNTDTEVKIKQVDGRWRICQTDTDHYLDNNGYETKELAQHAALTKGYSYSGVEEELPDTVEVPKPTKREKTKGTDKPEELKLGKETEQKLESIIRKVIKEERNFLKKRINEGFEPGQEVEVKLNGKWINGTIKTVGQKQDYLIQVEIDTPEVQRKTRNIKGSRLVKTTQDHRPAGKVVLDFYKEDVRLIENRINEADVTDTDLEEKAREYAAIANKMKLLEEELKNLEGRYTELDIEFRPLLENVGKTKGTFIRAGKLLIKIEREGYEKKSKSYKTGFDYLFKKVNATMKDLANEALQITESVSYVKSKIAVVEEGRLDENWFSKIKSFLSNKIKKLFGLNNKANKELDELESKLGK